MSIRPGPSNLAPLWRTVIKNSAIAVIVACLSCWAASQPAHADQATAKHFEPIDVFELEYAADPRIAHDGESIVYARTSMDIMKDSKRSTLWTINFDGSDHRPLTSSQDNQGSPRFSPDGNRLLFVSNENGSSQVYVRWLDTGQEAMLTQLPRGPSGLTWSPNGKQIAFSMLVPNSSEPYVKMPDKPKGAKWAESAKVISKLHYRADGRGYLEDGFSQLFVLSAEGGTPRQITSGEFNHRAAPVWTPDGRSLIFSANRHEEWEFDTLNSEIYEVELTSGSIKALTSRFGPDESPAISPDGSRIAYTGFDDNRQGYETRKIYVMNRDGSGSKLLSGSLDRGASRLQWDAKGNGIYFQYSDQGDTKIGCVGLDGKVETLTGHVGGLSLGRPYSGGSFTVSNSGRIAFTHTSPTHPADVAVLEAGQESRRITRLNDDLFNFKTLGSVEEIWFPSSFDGRKIQGWIVKPPDFDASKKYPLILEIHGGPFANYGNRFSTEIQLFASAGYVVLYANPRGSTSYGQEFGNLIHHNYPSEDYDDLMSGVDAVIERGYVDPDRLYVTGGSGGGVLTSWIVGKTDRFAAAVVAKPVINWASFALTADFYTFFHRYWFADYPWNAPEEYMRRSPLSLVGNVKTPTMLLTGEEDYRTPISESEQYYQALKLCKVETVMVRIPDASHSIAARPSRLISKVAHVLKWFDDHGGRTQPQSKTVKP
ncbi:MAG: acyl-peptide hydrolase [Phycisphaerae bacterium]|nr:MAG: acyl-peptide hydrolase [Phycisphaerae bacterium]